MQARRQGGKGQELLSCKSTQECTEAEGEKSSGGFPRELPHCSCPTGRYFIARSAEGDALVVVDATLTSDRATREAIPRAAQPSGGAGSAAPEEGPPAGGAFESSAAGAGSAPAKLHGRCTAAMEKSPESAATESDDDGVDADFRTLAVSIAHDLARGGGVSLEGW